MAKHTQKDFLLLMIVGVAFIFTGQMITQALVEANVDVDEAVTTEETPEVLPISQKIETEAPKVSSFERLLEFNGLATAQKAEWINFMADQEAKKAALVNKQHQEWSDFHVQQMNKLNGLIDWSVASKEAFFKEKLDAAIKLYKEQCAAWKEFGKNEHQMAQKLGEKQDADFTTKFEPKKVVTNKNGKDSKDDAEQKDQTKSEETGVVNDTNVQEKVSKTVLPEQNSGTNKTIDASLIPESFDFAHEKDDITSKIDEAADTQEFVFDDSFDDDAELE